MYVTVVSFEYGPRKDTENKPAMADPLSITSSIAGLISLAQSLIPLLSNIVADIRQYPEEFMAVCRELRAFCSLLHAIRPIVQRLEGQATHYGQSMTSRYEGFLSFIGHMFN